MQKKHLIALDLDGTLLTDDKQISPASKKVIQNLTEKGHIVVIATGRSNRVCFNYYKELNLQTPLVSANGAFVHHPNDKTQKADHVPIPQDMAMNIIEVCHTHQAKNILATVRDHVFLDKFDPHIVDFYGKKKEDDNFSIGPVYEHLKHDPTGMLIYPEKDNLEALTSALNDLDQKIINHWNWGEPFHVIELMNTAMNKWVAIEKIANKFDISRDRILAFGDGANDLEMIGNAGIGVAMENSVAPLQSIAKYHTASNEEHGVAQFLNDYFNLKQNIFAI